MPIPLLFIGIAAATAATGIGAGVSGANKIKEANEIVEDATYRYERAKEKMEEEQNNCTNKLEKLGKVKMDIWTKDLKRFIMLYEKIHNKPKFNGELHNEFISLTPEELKEFKDINLGAIDILAGVTGSIGAGALAGIGAWGGAMLLGTASTGTALSALSGAAATNATLAFFGGGSLAAGGLGIAGGTAVLGGLVAGPALAVGGLLLNSKGTQSLEKAYEVRREANKAIEKMETAENILRETAKTVQFFTIEIKKIRNIFLEDIEKLEIIVNEKYCDYQLFDENERNILYRTILSIKTLKELTQIQILKQSKNYEIKLNELAKSNFKEQLAEYKIEMEKIA
ncbi:MULTISPECIES: hypothetical protein [Caloramator]|uniref:Uncharacterized protein n=1 Tax=Caloramator proteoclasticus DSM 10124 TaxID=1121262 RepID=A0A1M4VUB1_9CLOT|nr:MULTISPECIES: hypothetical protein [Caloramator]SHE72661.1 hypothetical protein SAMN02746091_00996 [Caloramator proteoclasticus DSM 10124]